MLKACGIMHFLGVTGIVMPMGFGFLYPGLTGFDRVLGIEPLPFRWLLAMLGVLLILPGLYLIIHSVTALGAQGKGAPAIIHSQAVVKSDVYELVRHPMSLGMYLAALGAGLMAGSTYLTAATALYFIPVHVFYLKYFEELELELRHGQSYNEYKQRTPFLIPRTLKRI
ncbi:MAG: methyltransferase [Bacillota bacterium]